MLLQHEMLIVQLKVMKEMFEASVDGQAYDAERWGNYYKPRGQFNAPATATPNASAAPTATPAPAPAVAAPVAETVAAPVAEAVTAPTAPVETPAGGGQRAEDILAMIRNRQKTS